MATRRLLPLAFASGGCALVYQVVWTRELRLVFGASTQASAAVVAIFVAGLGLGAWKLGQRAERSERPLYLYALLEGGIALSGGLSPLLLGLARRSYLALGGSLALGAMGAALARLVLTALVLGVPTVLMGGTLPALARAATAEQGDPGRRAAAALYGANTLGGVAGCCLATFLLLERFGVVVTLLEAALLNVAVGLWAGFSWLRDREGSAAVTPEDSSDAPVYLPGSAPRVFVLCASAIVGFAFFLMELVFYRMLVPLTGGTVYTFGLVLAIALLGIGLGGLAYALFLARVPSIAGFAITCLLEAAGLAVPYALGDRIALLAIALRPMGALGFGGHVAAWSLITAIVVLPASLAAGVQFPMLVALLGRGRPGVARDVGLAYAANTLGAIAGAIAGGFGLMRLLTAPGCWRVASELLVGAGLAAAALAIWRPGRRWAAAAAQVTVGGGVLLLLAARGPTEVWRHQPIGAGRVPVSKIDSPEARERFARDARRAVMWQADGIESTVALDGANGYAFIVNAKSDGACRDDAGTQVMGGVLGALLHGQPRTAMVIGLGSGSSAGWLARVPSIERVDVAELEPAMLEVARRCAPVNEDVLDNPKVHVTFGDGRELLSVSRATYDVIFSEPSNPYRAGVASLYTYDYYRRVLEHLTEGGIFVQWLQAYEIDTPTMKTLLATAGTAFPSVEVWELRDPDLALVASRAPIAKDVGALRARMASEPYDRALRNTWGVDDVEGVLAHFVAGPRLVWSLAADGQQPLNTDDRPVVEFAFARAVNEPSSALDVPDPQTVRRAAGSRGGLDKPDLVGGESVDWSRVELERAEIPSVDGEKASLLSLSEPSDVSERIDFERAIQGGEAEQALFAWDKRPREPATRSEVRDLACALVDVFDERAAAAVDRLASLRPLDAAVLRAELAEHDKRRDDAVALLVPALVGFRTDPWASTAVMFRGILLAQRLAMDGGPAAEQLLDALKQPFALELLRESRLETAIEIAGRLDRQRDCRELLAPLEPNMIWRKTILDYRRDCYRATGDPRAPIAQQDIDLYEAERSDRFNW